MQKHLLSLEYDSFYSIWHLTKLVKAFTQKSKKGAALHKAELKNPSYTVGTNLPGLILMPGPIVGAMTQDLTYWPLAAAGFALTIASIKVSKFSCSFCTPKEALPIGQWMILVLSRRYSILPALPRSLLWQRQE